MRPILIGLAAFTLVASACAGPDSALPTGFSADEVLLDDGINPEDTWIVFDAAMTTVDTVDLTEPIVDAETGQTVSQVVLSSGPDTLYSVEAGYDFDRVLRVRLTAQ
jgi:hypothetical protein